MIKLLGAISMDKSEIFFNINSVLMTLFSSLGNMRNEKKIELIYEMASTIPKELKGDSVVLSRLLGKVLTFVFQNSDEKEIVLSLSAPEDFLYEEFISFKIEKTNITQEKIQDFLETKLSKELEILEGKMVYDNDSVSDIYLKIPFKINKLGHRRHYRLPNREMLHKKVLLICKSQKLAKSIEKMLKYFLYDVDVGANEFKKRGNDLTRYDIFIVEDILTTKGLEALVEKVQKKTSLKYILLDNSNSHKHENIAIKSTYLIKPVMQESIFKLVISLFSKEIQDNKIIAKEEKSTADLKKTSQVEGKSLHAENNVNQDRTEKEKLQSISQMKNEIRESILDSELGEENTNKMGLMYVKELKNFLYSFDHSDVYFREIVNEKAVNKIKEFCIDLEKQSKIIGAQSMSKFAESVSLVFVYNKLDTLSIYPGKYHMELKKLIKEINIYLD